MNRRQWPSLIILGLIGVCHAANEDITGEMKCVDSKDCEGIGGYCRDSKCASCGVFNDFNLLPCKPTIGRTKLFNSAPGTPCTPDDGSNVCGNMVCNSVEKKCSCKKGETFEAVTGICKNIEKRDRFDPTRDVIIPSVILMTLAATAWLCFRLFCNCGKTFRRRRRGNDVARALEEAQIPGIAPSQSTTWVASYRVFGPVSGVDSRSFPPCLLLPAGPPSYDEALKHKVILSSYQPPLMDDSLL